MALLAILTKASGSCYFPLEVQGEFMTQSLSSAEISYSVVSVLYNSIPGWGRCHARHSDHRLVLREDRRGGSGSCFRCIRMVARSKNVLQVHMNNIYECHDTEEEALGVCPGAADVVARSSIEMMLYKTRGFYGEAAVTKVHCPINGRYQFTYSNSETMLEQPACPELSSLAGNCPDGYKLDLNFRGCNFPDLDMSFQCLGHWRGEDGQNYLSLLDTKLPQLGEEARPRYRCAMYLADPVTGVTHLTLSTDSTCVNQLESPHSGYETLQLHSQEEEHIQEETLLLPSWAQGHWDAVSISGSQVTYRDEKDMITYKLTSLSSPRAGRYLVRESTACGDSSYSCMALERRSDNIMELRLGTQKSTTPDPFLCSESSQAGSSWVTQGRARFPTSCPLEGEFTGKLPDAEGLCTRSVTSCDKPDHMRYMVYNCNNEQEIYEDRLYQCYGQFQEDGLVYTFTKRIDLPGHECFVGWTLDNVQHLVTEAGTHCERGKDPQAYGMLLVKQSDSQRCHNKNPLINRPVSPRLVTSTVKPEKNTLQSHSESDGKHQSGENISHKDTRENELASNQVPLYSSSLPSYRVYQVISVILISLMLTMLS